MVANESAKPQPDDLKSSVGQRRIDKGTPRKMKLPKGLRISNGYLQLCIMHKAKAYIRNFGKPTKFAFEIAKIHLAEQRKKILMGTFDITPPVPRCKFKDVTEIYFGEWSKEIDPDGRVKHNKASKYTCRCILDNSLIPYFGDMWHDAIKPKDVKAWRDKCTQTVKGTSANRFQAVLSSLFNKVERLVKTESIAQFKLPEENPVKSVEKSGIKKRERILSKYEAQKLKFAFGSLKDTDGWEIVKLALKSVLSMKDLRNLELGQSIDIERAKTGVPINLPITILVQLNWKNWRKRWEKARAVAGLHSADRSKNVEFRDLRKTGINWIKGKHDIKLVSEFAGHADVRTTESFYTVEDAEKLRPLADDLSRQVDEI